MALTQGLQLPFGIQPVNALLVDSYAGPYNSVAEALSSIPSALRVQTRFVNIIDSGVGKLYWFKDGIADGDLVEFSSASGTVTSVGLSMPSAFSVANSPVTSSGTLTVTGAGLASQYVRGDGTLGDFPSTTGGGSSVSYYLNGSVNQGTFGGNTYYEMNKTPILGAGTDFSTSSDGYIASFITDVGDPNKLLIPAGNWNLELYFSASSGGGNPSFYVELYKYNGTTFTLIASSSAAPELISLGTTINPYFAALAVPETPLALTDRLALRVYVTTSGRTITLHTEDNHLCQIITTFSTGLTALNGLTAQVQYLTTGTSGTDFNIASSSDTHTFNIPVASATNTGKLSSTDWSTFNSKEPAIAAGTTLQYFRGDKTFQTLNTSVVPESGNLYFTNSRARSAISLTTIGTSGVATYDSGTGVFNIPQYQAALTNPVTGTGTTNYLPKFTGTSAIGDSQVFDNGTNVGIGTTSPSRLLHLSSTGDTYLRVDGQGFESLFGSDANGTVINQTGLTGISLRTANSDRMRITAGGRILMGTTSDNGTDRLQVSGSANFSSSVTASSFSGAGTGLTGTASSLSIGGNAATATTATNWAGSSALGSYAYRSSGLAELSGATFTGDLIVNKSSGDAFLRLNNPNATTSYVRLDDNNTIRGYFGMNGLTGGNNADLVMYSNTGALRFFANAIERLTLASSGNVGIGTTSPSARLDVQGGSIINGNGTIQTAITYATMGIIGTLSNHDLGIYTNNTEKIRVTSTGNVGIGTTSPSSRLEVTGQITGASGNEEGKFRFVGYNGAYGGIYSNTGFSSAYNNVSIYSNVNATRNGQGNSTLPSWFIDLGGNIPDGDSFSVIRSAAGTWSFVNLFKITGSGNVGIGTSSPAYLVHARRDQADGTIIMCENAATGNTFNYASVNALSSSAHGAITAWGTGSVRANTVWVQSVTNHALVFGTNDTERMRIAAGGNVGIGTASPSSSASIPLTLNATGTNIGTQILFTNSYATAYCGISADTRGDIVFQVDGTGSGSDKGIKLNTNGNNTRLYVTNGGEVYIAGLADQGAFNLQVNGTGVWAAGAYVNGSDQRLKENIQDIDKGLEYINKVRPVKFNYKRDYSRDRNVHTGFIAQQLQSVFANEDYLGGMVQEGAHLNVAYQNLIPIMVKAIQEQQIEIENLKAQLK